MNREYCLQETRLGLGVRCVCWDEVSDSKQGGLLESKGTPGICVFLMCCCIIPSRRCYPAQSFQNFELNKHVFSLQSAQVQVFCYNHTD